MTHFIVLIIVPQHIYKQGQSEVESYIASRMRPYDRNLKIQPPYIQYTEADLNKMYEEYKKHNDPDTTASLKDYCVNYCGYKLNQNGNAVSTFNKNSFFDSYVIGGLWNGLLTNNQQLQYQLLSNYENHTIINNSCKIKDYLERYCESKNIENHQQPCTIIDVNGILHKVGQYGWFEQFVQITQQNKWKQAFENVLHISNHDNYLVGLDCSA